MQWRVKKDPTWSTLFLYGFLRKGAALYEKERGKFGEVQLTHMEPVSPGTARAALKEVLLGTPPPY